MIFKKKYKEKLHCICSEIKQRSTCKRLLYFRERLQYFCLLVFGTICSLNWKIAIQYLYFGSHSYSLNSGTYPTSVFKKLFLSLILAYSQNQYLNPSFEKDSVQFSRSVVSDSLRPHESQHARPPWSSPTPGVYPNLCPSSK